VVGLDNPYPLFNRVYELPIGGAGHSKRILRDLIKASSSLNSFTRLMQIGQGLVRLSSHRKVLSKCSSLVGIVITPITLSKSP
jgi:hypothetical protein